MQQHGANILPIDPDDPGGWGLKIKIPLFQNMFNCTIKLKAMRMQ